MKSMIKIARTEQSEYAGNLGDFNYFQSTTEEKIIVLDFLLADDFVLMRNSENGNVVVYDIMMDEYIHDNGRDELSLHILMNNLIEVYIQGDSLY
jgi:hypothetical protein